MNKQSIQIQDRNQIGQALLDFLIFLMLFMTLIFAIQFSGKNRMRSIELLTDSSYQTFLKTLGRADSKDLHLKKTENPNDVLQKFSDQLLETPDQGLIGVRRTYASMTREQAPARKLFGDVALHRSSYLYVNAGNSETVHEPQSRIARSNLAWRNTSSRSQSLIHQHSAPIAAVDSPWQRARVSTDWLSSWAGQSPDRMRKSFTK